MSQGESAGPDRASSVRAAGGIVLRAAAGGGWEVALIHRPVASDWTLPKGKIEAGEAPAACALREVLEETGWSCKLGRFAGEVEYLDRRNRIKVVSYWMMQPLDGEFTPNAEVDELRWLSISLAARLLSFDHDRELLISVTGALVALPE